tara:strand:+ start:4793 stop:5125 length:333 start_codon:yes stop_codon:yes gene_type:complete
MDTSNSNTQETVNLSGTKWSVTTQNVQGTFHFKTDNTGTYITDADPETKFYWWQSGNSFWMQQRGENSEWFSIMEGQLTADNLGGGQFVVAKKKDNTVYLSSFDMTKDIT